MSDDLTPTGEDTTAEETQGGSTEATQPSHEDRLNDRIAEITGRLPDLVSEAVAQSMSQWQESQAPDDEDDPEDEFDLDPGDEGYEEQALRQFLTEQIEQGVEKRIAPFQQQQQLDKRNDAYHSLTQELTELQDPKVAAEYVHAAEDLAQRINPQIVNTPEFVELIELVYTRAKAQERAKQETPADGRTTPLESQGGAAPREDAEELDDRLSKKAQSLNSF